VGERVKLHTVFVTHNRLELTKRAIESYQDTVTVDYELQVVDNDSSDGTVEWLRECPRGVDWLLLHENHFPGYATNQGWANPWREATHLHRADNDFVFASGWCEEVERMFEANPGLGQLGLRTDEQEAFADSNVGGNCVIRREVWDAGARWDERTWPQLSAFYGPGITEDSLFTETVEKLGWQWDRVEKLCILPMMDDGDPNSPYREYHIQTWKDRRIYGYDVRPEETVE
jgi:glycosyltransferase involved in cell wall biosynthesis